MAEEAELNFDTMRGTAFFKRSVAALSAGALSAGAVVALGAPASANAHIQDLRAACQGLMASVGFGDIQSLNPQTQGAINCLAEYGITQGRTPTTYAPRDAVKRYEMAIFLDRLVRYVDANDTVGVNFTMNTSDAGFDDLKGVPQAGVNAINAIAHLGIAKGKTANAYDPFAPVTRRDMATFINRVQEAIAAQVTGYEGYSPAAATKQFDDVPSTLPRHEDIYALEAAGIVQGTDANTYKPFADVLRSEMAFFIMRHLNENIAAGRIASLADTTPPTVAPGAAEVGGTTAVFTANEDIDAASVEIADFTETAAGTITGVTASGATITVTFDTALTAGETVTLLANSIADVAGNLAPSADVTATAADTTAPTVTAGTATAGGTTVEFVADEDIDAATVAVGDFSETAAGAITGVSTAGGTITVTFDTALAAGETVTLLASSIADLAGNLAPASDVTATVATAADTTAPSVTADALAAGATTATFTANEDLDAATVEMADVTTTSTTATITGVSAAGAVITVTFSAGVAVGDQVTLAAKSVADAAGNLGPAAAETATAVDATAPAAPAVTNPTSPGHVNTDVRFLAGTTEANAQLVVRDELGNAVEVREDPAVAGGTSATADAAGAFDFYVVLSPNRANDFTIVAIDAAANESGATIVPTITQDNIAPGATVEAGTAGGNTIGVTFTEAINKGDLTATDITINGAPLADADATITFGATAEGATTATVTLTSPRTLAAGETVTLVANAVTDFATNPGPTTAVSDTVV